MKILDLKQFIDNDGCLIPLELEQYIDFVVKRIFYVCNVPKGEERGFHAHFETKQLLICMQGGIVVNIYDGIKLQSCLLKPHQAVFVDKMLWDSQVFTTGNDILMVLCSTKYDKNDYIEDLNRYNKLIEHKKVVI